MDGNISHLRLSVLDQAPVSEGSTAAEALGRSIRLARHVETLGFHRFWMSEHHAIETLACTAPEIMLARIGAETTRIRLGSGGIMLPHYAALKVAEQFKTISALYPGRIDLGIGRAPGGGPNESLALRRERRVQPADDFADQISELLAFLDGTFPDQHPFSRIRLVPEGIGGPDVWLLGSSSWSASAAAEFGLPYAFAHFFSALGTRRAIETYLRDFVPSAHRSEPEAMAAVGVVCAETEEEAQYLHASVRLLQRQIRMGDRRPVSAPEEALRRLRATGGDTVGPGEDGDWPRYFVGTPDQVRHGLEQMSRQLGIRELMINTIIWDHAARLRSYNLLADAFGMSVRLDAATETSALTQLSDRRATLV